MGRFLRESDIECSNYFVPIHLQGPYQELGYQYGDFPITEEIGERTVALPFGPHLSEDNIIEVSETLKKALDKFS